MKPRTFAIAALLLMPALGMDAPAAIAAGVDRTGSVGVNEAITVGDAQEVTVGGLRTVTVGLAQAD